MLPLDLAAGLIVRGLNQLSQTGLLSTAPTDIIKVAAGQSEEV